MSELTVLLSRWRDGDEHALEELLPFVYGELRQVADRYLRKEREGHTLQPTALVHEAFLRLIGQNVTWQNRAHFFGVAAEMMRRILVDHARKRQAGKRGGGLELVRIEDGMDFAEHRDLDLVALDEALTQLATFDPQQSRIIELRFFAGLGIEETAEALGVSASTIKREWRVARAWLLRELER
jgi:RNA polymerase sigma-70 factor (ECF subfamily)